MKKLKYFFWKLKHSHEFIRVNNVQQYNKIIKLTGHKFRDAVTLFHKDVLKDKHPVFIHTRLATSRIKNTIWDDKVIPYAIVQQTFKL